MILFLSDIVAVRTERRNPGKSISTVSISATQNHQQNICREAAKPHSVKTRISKKGKKIKYMQIINWHWVF